MIDLIRNRAKLLSDLRAFFDTRDFCEVQPPTVCRDCVVDAYLDPITIPATELGLPDNNESAAEFFLQTSPESAMKRMLSEMQSAGATPPSVYSIGPVYRKAETGTLHNVEFTMLEWYEVGGDIESAIELTGRYVSEMLSSDGYDRTTYRQSFQDALGFDPLEIPIASLRAAVHDIEPDLTSSIGEDRDAMLDILMSSAVAPILGIGRPTVVTEYPLSQAALAKRSDRDPQCAARFELFASGVELANGYDELLDAQTLSDRYDANNVKRKSSGRPMLDTKTTLVEAMRAGLPPCSGVALGIDRLFMLRVGAEKIEQVLSFPIFEA